MTIIPTTFVVFNESGLFKNIVPGKSKKSKEKFKCRYMILQQSYSHGVAVAEGGCEKVKLQVRHAYAVLGVYTSDI